MRSTSHHGAAPCALRRCGRCCAQALLQCAAACVHTYVRAATGAVAQGVAAAGIDVALPRKVSPCCRSCGSVTLWGRNTDVTDCFDVPGALPDAPDDAPTSFPSALAVSIYVPVRGCHCASSWPCRARSG